MPSTYTLISSNVLSSSAASVTFSAIPSTYTDLVLRVSARTDEGGGALGTGTQLRLNGLTTNKTARWLYTDSGSALSAAFTNYGGTVPANGQTANTFSNGEIYIPNYLSTANKPLSTFNVSENDSATSATYIEAIAGLFSNASTISSMTMIVVGCNFVSGSSFYLYGIKNS